MHSEKDYYIPFEGLKLGLHEFDFKLNNDFFSAEMSSFIEKGQLNLKFKLDKKERLMVGSFSFEGYVIHPCDLCTDDVKVQLEDSFEIIYKFGNELSDDESLVMVPDNEFEINLIPSCIDFIAEMLPSKNVHDEGNCNEEMLKLLEKYSIEGENDNIDPRWESLKKLN